MLETLEMAPSDPILGLNTSFNQDSNPNKINLGVGVYKDSEGNTPIFRSVRRAEEIFLGRQTTKNYLPISGAVEFSGAVRELLFGFNRETLSGNRVATIQVPGGTGALRIAGDFIHQKFQNSKIWMSEPTWANHPNLFRLAGLEVKTYPYFDSERNNLDFDAMVGGLHRIPRGDFVLLHGCCHNPTGIDPTPDQWEVISKVVRTRGIVPLIDFAYQGLGDGIVEDGRGLRALCRSNCEVFVASSFSKNFGIYNERVGALTVVTSSEETARAVLSHLMIAIRTNYSNPPAHGAGIVTTVLNDKTLRADWESEVKEVRDRINGMRRLFVNTLRQKGIERDLSFIVHQRGMFSFSGLTVRQVDLLREKYSIYVLRSGRINVAGMTEGNMEYLCDAILDVLNL